MLISDPMEKADVGKNVNEMAASLEHIAGVPGRFRMASRRRDVAHRSR
ncbi:MAG: hypothetical protein ACTHL1_10050 [Burkholderiaceae bacterium]